MNKNCMFVAFSSVASRSRRIASKLNIPLIFYKDRFPYVFSSILTIIKILRAKPKSVILQLTQGPILFLFIILKKLIKFKLIGDVHSGFLIYLNLKGKILNFTFSKLIDHLDLIIVHNKEILKIVSKKNKTLLLYDPLINEVEELKIRKNKTFVFVPIMKKPDEPIRELIKASEELKSDFVFISTGKKIENIKCLGYLSYENYLKVLKTCDIVLALTKREFTLLSIIFEAISLGKPIIASETLTIKNFLKDNALYTNHENLAEKIKEMKMKKEIYKERITKIRNEIEKIEKINLEKIKKFIL
jgi:glycosyltransferase involved in cell wall biosynthesis